MVISWARRDSMMRAPHHRRHVAAEAQAQRQEALAVQAEPVHVAVGHEGGPRQVAGVLEQPEGEEEQRQQRQEGEHDAGATQHAVGRSGR
jgi:hypothetical protein